MGTPKRSASAIETPPKTLAEWLAQPGAPSQRALADLVGCGQSMIALLAQKKRAARGKLALELAEKTGLPVEEFLTTK